MTEPTLVVAMAAALASVGAAMEEKLTPLKLADAAKGAATASSPPPQADSSRLPAKVDARGSMGAPAKSCRARRRDKAAAGFIRFRSGQNRLRTTKSAGVSGLMHALTVACSCFNFMTVR